MRVFNKKQLNQIPMVDGGNLQLDNGEYDSVRSKIARKELEQRRMVMRKRAAALAKEAKESKQREIMAARHAAMLARSVRRSGLKEGAAIQKQGLGFVAQYGIKNPMLGFVDECRAPQPDYLQQEVYPAEEFNNHLTAKNNERYLKNKDYPLVEDACSDYGGGMINESGTADFSQRFIDEADSDFGKLPPRRMPKR